MFLFGHEVLHVVYDHMGRFGGRDKQLANIAADYCVNGDLVKNNIGPFWPPWADIWDHVANYGPKSSFWTKNG